MGSISPSNCEGEPTSRADNCFYLAHRERNIAWQISNRLRPRKYRRSNIGGRIGSFFLDSDREELAVTSRQCLKTKLRITCSKRFEFFSVHSRSGSKRSQIPWLSTRTETRTSHGASSSRALSIHGWNVQCTRPSCRVLSQPAMASFSGILGAVTGQFWCLQFSRN